VRTYTITPVRREVATNGSHEGDDSLVLLLWREEEVLWREEEVSLLLIALILVANSSSLSINSGGITFILTQSLG